MAFDAAKSLMLNLTLATNFAKETGYAERELRKLLGMFDFLKKATVDYAGTANFLMKNVLVGTALWVGTATNKLVELNKSLAVSTLRHSVLRRDVEGYKKAIFDSSIGSGIAIDQIDKLNNALLESGYRFGRNYKEMSNLSKTIFQFSTITGISTDTAIDFASELSNIGIKSDDLFESLAKLQANYQLTGSQMKELINITKDVTLNLTLFSNTAKSTTTNLAHLTEKLQNTAAQMLTLGVNASDVQKIMEGLTDPMSYVDNAKSMSLLGFGLNDVSKAMQGLDVNAALRIRNRLQELQKMGPLAFSAITKEIGLSKQAIAAFLRDDFAEMMKANEEKRKIGEVWKDAMKQSANFGRAWTNLVNKILQGLQPVANAIAMGMGALSKVLDFLSSNSKLTFALIILLATGAYKAIHALTTSLLKKISTMKFALDSVAKSYKDIAAAATAAALAQTASANAALKQGKYGSPVTNIEQLKQLSIGDKFKLRGSMSAEERAFFRDELKQQRFARHPERMGTLQRFSQGTKAFTGKYGGTIGNVLGAGAIGAAAIGTIAGGAGAGGAGDALSMLGTIASTLMMFIPGVGWIKWIALACQFLPMLYDMIKPILPAWLKTEENTKKTKESVEKANDKSQPVFGKRFDNLKDFDKMFTTSYAYNIAQNKEMLFALKSIEQKTETANSYGKITSKEVERTANEVTKAKGKHALAPETGKNNPN